MYAFILLGLALALVAPDLATAEPPPDLPAAALGAAAATAGVFVAGLAISGYLRWRRGVLEQDPQRFLRRVGRLSKIYRLLVVAAYAAVLFPLGWAAFSAMPTGRQVGAGGPEDWTLPVLGLTLLPFVAMVLAAWTALYWADRRLRTLLVVQAAVGAAVPPWSLPRYLEFMVRQYLLILLGPLVVLMAIHDALHHTLGPVETRPLSAALFLAAVFGTALLAGPWFRVCWRTEVLPDGELRRRLLALGRRAGVRIGRILVWRTNLSIANGCLVGLVGPLRYVMVTDALLLNLPPEEVEAVFAHEVAHAKHHHVFLYFILALGGAGAAMLVGEAADALTRSAWAAGAALAVFVLAYWGIGFGFLSRRCELECDLYAVRATACPAACSPPNAGAHRPAADVAFGPCEHRVMTFTSALRRIAHLNGASETARSWRHFSVARRCRFLLGLLVEPGRLAAYECRFRKMRWAALLLALLLGAAAGGYLLAAP